FAAVDAVRRQSQGSEFLSLAGPGFRDFTRIAASDAHVWRDILLANRHQVIEQSQLLRERLAAFEHAMQADDPQALETLIREASAVRARWKMGQGLEDH
ncbi:MAG: hypothetical protein RL513_1736, partial [Pseudomonadota bacterium]